MGYHDRLPTLTRYKVLVHILIKMSRALAFPVLFLLGILTEISPRVIDDIKVDTDQENATDISKNTTQQLEAAIETVTRATQSVEPIPASGARNPGATGMSVTTPTITSRVTQRRFKGPWQISIHTDKDISMATTSQMPSSGIETQEHDLIEQNHRVGSMNDSHVGEVEGNSGTSEIFDNFALEQFTWVDVIITICCTVASLLLLVNIAFFAHYCFKKGPCCGGGHNFTPARPVVEAPTTHQPRVEQSNANVNVKTPNYRRYRCPRERVFHHAIRSPCQSRGSVNSISTGVSTLSVGTQYENMDALVASFLSEELIGELNDRDSNCTSVSDGFQFVRDYELRPYPEGSTEF